MTDTAYYYPAPFWLLKDSDWIKSLLLFFDDVAILLPDYMYGLHTNADPTLAEPLEDRGLLRVLEPNDWVDQEITEKLAEIVVELLRTGAFDDLPQGEDGVSIPLHPEVRTAILVILGQLSRVAGARRDMTIHPTTNHGVAATDLVETLSRDKVPSRGKVIELDLEPVTFNLESIPLDGVLQFRAEHQDAHKAYMRDLRGFMVELAEIEEPNEREAVLLERRQEIADSAHAIQRSTRRALGKNLTSWSLGITGGAWAVTTWDLFGLALSALGGILNLVPENSERVMAYSYIFDADRTFGSSDRW